MRWLKDRVIGDLGDTLWILMGTMSLLLLIACANVANLMLVRTQSRRSELMLRSALGASWAAIARIVFTESAVVGLAGGLAGVGVAYLGLPALLSLGADDLPHLMAVSIDPVVLLVAAGTAVFATLVAAGVPAMQLALRGPRFADALRGGRSMSEGPEGLRARQALVVAQVATALVLLVGSGLMIRTFVELRRVNPGFRAPEGVQTFQLTVPRTGPLGGDAGAVNRANLLRTQRAIQERLADVGGVDAVGFALGNDGLPLDGDGRQLALVPYVDGKQPPDGLSRIWEVQSLSPGFLETLRTRIVSGRSVDWNDVANQRAVMLVSERLARREWGTAGAALGRRISAVSGQAGAEIIGVVEDVHHDGLHQPPPETVIYPPRAAATASYVVRSARAGRGDFLRDLRQAVWSVHSELSLARPQTLGDMYRRAMARASMTLLLLGITGALALMLGLIGIYGVVSYDVSRRRREIGIRLALGARRTEVSGMFVKQALALVGIGVLIGLGAAAGLTRLIASQLFGVSALDLPTHLAVAAGLAASAVLAGYVSARRGANLDPADVLKGE